jgi:hypothetical protein
VKLLPNQAHLLAIGFILGKASDLLGDRASNPATGGRFSKRRPNGFGVGHPGGSHNLERGGRTFVKAHM